MINHGYRPFFSAEEAKIEHSYLCQNGIKNGVPSGYD